MSDEPWTLDHQSRIVAQTEARPGSVQPDGTRWVERRLTGKGAASCSCGYSTGLIPREQLPAMRPFTSEHTPFGQPSPMGGEPA